MTSRGSIFSLGRWRRAGNESTTSGTGRRRKRRPGASPSAGFSDATGIHVTYFVFGGSGGEVAEEPLVEASRSVLSLWRLAPATAVLLLTNTPAMAAAAQAKLSLVKSHLGAPGAACSVGACTLRALAVPDAQSLATLRAYNFSRFAKHYSHYASELALTLWP